MKKFLFVLLFSGAMSSGQVFAGLPDDLSLPFSTVDASVPAAPYPILKPLPDGPLSILFFGDAFSVAPVAVGTASRIDCHPESILTPSRKELGVSAGAESNIPASLSESSIRQRLAAAVEIKRDAIWCDFDLDALPEHEQDAILRQVTDGAALVVFGARSQYERLATGKSNDFHTADWIGYRSLGTIETLSRGKGAIIIMPSAPEKPSPREWGDYLNAAAAVLHRISAPQSPFTVNDVQISEKPVEQEAIGLMRLRLEIHLASGSDSLRLMVRCRDQENKLVYQDETSCFIDRKALISVRYPAVPVGTYSLDITGVSGGNAVFFIGRAIEVAAAQRISNIRFWSPATKRNDFLIGTVTMEKPFQEGQRMEIDLRDAEGALLESTVPQLVPLRKSVDFIFKLQEEYPRAVQVAVSFFRNNEHIETLARPYIVSDLPEDRNGFLLGVYDNCALPSLSPEAYRSLTGAGVSLLGQKIDQRDSFADSIDRASSASYAGLRVIPDFSSPETLKSGETSIEATALLDSLRVLDPFAVGAEPGNFASALRAASPYDMIALFRPFPDSVGSDNSSADYDIFISSKPASRNSPPSGIGSRKETQATGFIIPDTWKYPADERALRSIPWWALFSGYSQLWWYPLAGTWNAAFTPQGALSRPFEDISGEMKTISGGIGTLLQTLTAATPDTQAEFTVTDAAGKPLPSVLATLYRDGDITYVGISLIPSAQSESYPDSCLLHIGSSRNTVYVYDMLQHSTTGASRTITCSLDHGAALYALMPYRVRDISLSAVTLIASEDSISFSIGTDLFENTSPGRHLFTITLTETGGKGKIYPLGTVDAPNGTCRKTIHVSNLNPGNYQLMACDLATGRNAERMIIVRAKEK